MFAGSAGAGGLLPGDLAAAAGTPSNLGKIGDAGMYRIYHYSGYS
jgi:ATPase family AAA domain-containing protein 2